MNHSFCNIINYSCVTLFLCLFNISSTLAYDYTDHQPYSQLPPQGLSPNQVPLFFSIGFDDNSLSGIEGSGGTGGMTWILDYLRNKNNPVGIGNLLSYDSTPIRVSFYNSSKYHENTVVDDPFYVKKSWHTALIDGHEIGIHTVNHLHGSGFSVGQWSSEIGDTVSHLSKPFDPNELPNNSSPLSGMGADPLKLTGFRTPFLEYNDEMFSVLVQQGYTYDTSIEEGWEFIIDGSNYPWPYTLDSGSPGNQYMLDSGFPNKVPLTPRSGLWELGVNPLIIPPDNMTSQYGVNHSIRNKAKSNMPWLDLNDGKITGFDYNLWALAKLNKAESLATLKYTLDLRLQNGNRAPFMLGAHTDYFGSKNVGLFPHISVRERQEVIEEFITYAQSKPEVRIVPFVSILNWMRNPSAIDCSVNCSATTLPPLVTNPGNQSNEIDSLIELTIEATDPNGLTLSFSAENLPIGLSIDSISGLINGIVNTANLNSVNIKVDNGEKITTVTFDWEITTLPNAGGDTPLIAGYPFEEGNGQTVLDLSGNGNNGTLAEGAIRNLDGNTGEAIEFNGADSSINLGAMNFTTPTMSIALWFKPYAFGTSDARLISKANGTASSAHYWMISTISQSGQSRLRFQLKTQNGGTSTLIGNTTLILGVWTHVTATYDGINMKLFQNSIQVGNLAKTGAISTSSSIEAWIGANPSNTNFFDGLIDDVRLYGEALSGATIQELVTGNLPLINDSDITSDTESPSTPSNLTAQSTVAQVDLNWTASTDAQGTVTSYRVFRDAVEVGTSTTTAYTDDAVQEEQSYLYTVSAIDDSGNESNQSTTLVVNTPAVVLSYTIYEDGEDGTTDGWIVYDQNPAGATITNVDDADTASRIILFQGEGLQNGYRLGGNGGTPEAWNNASKVINWDMKFEESFVIYITVETTLGQRYLTYNQSSTSKIDGIYIINGLDNNQGTINSQWTSVSRNLESDLQVFEPTNEIISVNGFLVRGDGRIDNIKLPETTVNTAPTVDAGVAQTIALSVDATLDGTVSDDGLPTTPGTVTTLWTLISGPTGGTVLFADATQVDTTANFSVEGTYVLDLDADDSELASNDQITITVNAGGIDTTAPTIVGTISTTVTETTAILTWVTDEPTTSTVNYGENTTYSDTDNTDNVLVTNHSITLSNLTPETEYHFEVISSDGADNSATSADQSFTTSTQSIQNYTIYEDGEDGTTDGWIIYDQNPAGATITNVDDTDTASRIILFQGEGLQNGYRLGGNGGTPEAWNNASKVINWDMKFEESFVIYITVETTLGQRYLTYNQSSTSKIDGIYIINGLDNNQGTINSQWTSVSRNLESDLQVFEPTNEIISVNGFLVRGDGRIDNIKLPETTVNTAPTVDAGVAQTIALSVDATLDGTVSDDGLPTTPGAVTTLWTLISGPTGGTVLFADATQANTTATFSVEGTYVLDLDADDSELTSNDQITITVNTGGIDTTAPTIVGTISTTVTETTAILTWVTDEPTTSTVNYGENTTYSDTDNTDNVLVTNHSITLSNLTPETEYHFEVISSDGADNSATSADQSFTTSTQSIQNYTIYEDGEDRTTDGWIIYDQDPAGATITNVDDTDTASRIILFQGEGLQNGYRLGGNGGTPEAWNNASKVINWDMKFEESFVIYITVETTLGQRYLTYNQSSTSKIDGIYIINGLDNNQGTINSQWTSVSRNLESDLQVFEPTNEIISVNGFLVRGDGRIDNIKLPETTVNTAPTVDAGVAQTINLSAVTVNPST